MKTSSFKKYYDTKPKNMGVAIIRHFSWSGPSYEDLYPDPFVSVTKFERAYRDKLSKLDKKRVAKALSGCILISDKYIQRKLINEWLECDEL